MKSSKLSKSEDIFSRSRHYKKSQLVATNLAKIAQTFIPLILSFCNSCFDSPLDAFIINNDGLSDCGE